MNKEIMGEVADIRRKGVPFYSNIYSFQIETIREFKKSENALAVLVQDRDVKRVLFAACNLGELVDLIKDWPSGTGLDFLSKKDDESIFEDSLKAAGFNPYAIYLKAENNKISDTFPALKSSKYEYDLCEACLSEIKESDADKIIEFLYEMFNPLTSHIEAKDEICSRIARGDIVAHKENGKFTTLLTFNPKPKKLYMEHMLNRGDSKYMHLLYYYVLKKEVEKGITSVDTWIREGNERAFNFVKRYGLVPNGLRNYVFCKE